LFVSGFWTPFIQDDIDHLSKHFSVKRTIGSGGAQVIRILLRILSADVVFCWFASTYAALAVAVGKFFGITSVIVVGGVDVAKEPELKYGVWNSRWRSILVQYALRHATKVLVVDPSLAEEAKLRAGYDGKNILYLPTGYDGTFWKPRGEKQPIVLTVAVALHENRFHIKGVHYLIEVAKRLPDVRFRVVGVEATLLKKYSLPPNIEWLPVYERRELLPLYQSAKVYCQPSLREGLPNTVCEAMLCGCIPVVTAVGGSVTAVGDVGVLVTPRSVESLVEGIEKALAMPENESQKARARILSMFPKEKRELELVSIIKECAS
jgi:glycosyltransferase involved in cell wall biosynthesis